MSDHPDLDAAGSADQPPEAGVAGSWVDWLTVREALDEAGIPSPPSTIEWPDEWYALTDHCFATWQAEARAYDLDAVMREAFALDTASAAILGHDGHGFNSWAMHAVLRRGPVLVGFQTAHGGAFQASEASDRRIAATWTVLADIAAAVDRLGGVLPQGKRLVALDSDIAESRWAWIAPGVAWDDADWQVSGVAGSAVRTMLEKL